MGLRGEQANDEREAHVIAAPDLVQEVLVRRDDDVQALQRVAGDSPRVRAIRDRELGAAGGSVEDLPWITCDGAAEVADPVGQAAGCCAGMVGDLGKLVALEVDGHALQAVGHRIRPQPCHDVVAVKAVERVDQILDI